MLTKCQNLMSASQLRPSKLGTKAHWDNVYEEELSNFEEMGDEGEVWFGVESIEKIVKWAVQHVPPSEHLWVLEIGTGNGTLLFALVEVGYAPSSVSGIDYSPDAVKLAQSIARSRGREQVQFNVCDFLKDDPPMPSLKHGSGHDAWDLLLDKGTFDAIALGEKDENGTSPAAAYPSHVARLLKPGGHFLITSCNFTEDELKTTFTTSETGLTYHSRIQHPTFTYGGKTGSICSSVAFQKSSSL